MTQSGGTVWVKDVLYNHAGQMTELWERQVDDGVSSQPFARTVWTYNALQQLTRITTTPVVLQPGAQDIEYRYSATQNDRKIEQMKNWVTGEEVTYQYDALERLISALTTGPEWGLSFSYDGFGNRLTQSVTKGTAPTSSLNYNAATNRITNAGYGYDANGNMTQVPGVPAPMVYDAWNRLSAVGSWTNGQGQIVPQEEYSYSPDNKRVYKKTQGSELFFFWMGGRLMSTHTLAGGPLTFTTGANIVYFAGRRLKVMGTDRLGSDISGTKYFPYGEESVTTTQNRFKFATYYRDGTTGLDYADQRYYSSAAGRFLTADPYVASASTANPTSWNRYGYVSGDPINYTDPRGLDQCPASSGNSVWVCDVAVPLDYDSAEYAQQFYFMAYYYSGAYYGASPYAPQTITYNPPPSITAAKKRMIDRIDDDCAEALGFKDSADALRQLDKVSITYESMGVPTYVNKKLKSGFVGEANPVTDRIKINSDINWNNLKNQGVIVDGQATVMDLLAGQATAIGVASVTPVQYFDLTVLHELAHTKMFGGKNPDKIEVETEIWRNCIRW